MTTSSSRPASSFASEPVDLLAATPHALTRALIARRSEYVRHHQIRVKVGTWNVAACPGTDKDLAAWFVAGRGLDDALTGLDLGRSSAVEVTKSGCSESVRLVGGEEIGLYVLGLQEVVDLNTTREYMNRAVYTDHGPRQKWQAALEAALPAGYQLVVAEQMTGILLLVYASPEVAPTISNVSTKQVGTGLLGYFGNKGAVTTRLVLGETTRMVFVNCHLASGASSNALDRRCWDVGQILTKTRFDPVVHGGVVEDDGEGIGDEDFCFWMGDLNFRLEKLPGEDIRRLLTLHTRGEYDVDPDRPPAPLDGDGFIVMRSSESDDDASTITSAHSRERSYDSKSSGPDAIDFLDDPSQDPVSLQSTLESLLPHDQLRRLMMQRKLFHDGWREGRITFLPSYKYDVGTIGLFDSSDKKRAPSWCDRILYRTRKDKQAYDRRVSDEAAVSRKDAEMKTRGIEEDDDVLFSYDPDADGEDEEEEDDQQRQRLSKGSPRVEYDEYDDAATEDGGTPGDEVVTKEGFVDRVSQELYASHQRITSSDHKPVVSVFTLDYDAVVPELKAHVHAEVARELDRVENEGRPAITVVVEGDGQQQQQQQQPEGVVDFGPLGFLERKTCALTIANTGSVVATFAFVEKPRTMMAGEGEGDGDEHVEMAPSWLTTCFVRTDGGSGDGADDGGSGPATEELVGSVALEPGETVSAQIEASVSAVSLLRALNDGQAKLEDILVLRVEDGRDHFVPVRASWLPSCFGRSVEELIRVPEGGGIRAFVLDSDIRGAIPYDSDVRCSAPRELFKLTEAMQTLAERCAADEAMLEDMRLPRDPGWPLQPSPVVTFTGLAEAARADLVAALETDAPLLGALPPELSSAHKLELVSSVLLLFLSALTDGLVPPLLCAKLSSALPPNLVGLPATAVADVKMRVLDVLSSAPNHNIAFVFLTATASRVASELSPSTGEAGDSSATAGALSGLSRRLSFRRGSGDDDGSRTRRAREKKYAEILGPLVFRAGGEGDKDKAARERERAVMDMFLRREARG
ncbi:phosphatase family protein [Ophiocordyceps camponoti-floridani]|uniref:Phosphatase family protein n=1 Tax=Ophiocordyceps camponoti-floridani TaxID=2030778 RepID=A0A8H4Q7B8_9HYPO|nr:phosphatase family protein [Ophiocordyceps camponoti-floridani]